MKLLPFLSIILTFSCVSTVQAQRVQAEEYLPPGSTKVPKKYIVDFSKPIAWELTRFTSEDIEQVMYAALAYMTDPMIQMSALNGWRIGTVLDWIRSRDPENPKGFVLASGMTISARKIILVFAFQKCLADSAMIHEIAHALGYNIHTKDGHKWIEEIKRWVVADLCGLDYQSGPTPPPHARGFIKPESIEL